MGEEEDAGDGGRWRMEETNTVVWELSESMGEEALGGNHVLSGFYLSSTSAKV